MTRTITLTLPMQAEFLSDIIINASETSYSWFSFDLGKRRWRDHNGNPLTNHEALERRPPDSDSDYVCVSCPLRYDRPDDDEGTLKGRFTLDHDAVAEGIRRIVSGEVKCGMRDDIAAAVAAQDAGCIDANLGDLIVQAAVFNEIVYG